MQKIDRRSTFMHWQIHKDGRADLRAAPDGRIPVAVALGLDPVTAYSASAPLPKHIGELMVAGFLKGSAVQLVKCKTVDLEVPANAEIVLEGWVDRTRRRDRGPVRRPHRLLHPARGVPDLPHLGDHDAPRRDLPVDRRRQAAGRGRVARQGDRAHLPAGDPDERARDRRLRPADGGHLPQLRHRLDPQELPRPREEGDARDVGARPDEPDEVGRRRRRARRRARLRAGLLLRLRERRSRRATSCSARARSTSSTTRPRSRPTAARSGSTRPRRGRTRAGASGRRRSR